MIWPDWQYPHWITSRSSHAFWIFWPAGVSPIASMVVTGESPTLCIGVLQERMGVPFICNGAGAAQRHATAELGTRHAEHVAQDPQKWDVPVDVDGMLNVIDLDGERHGWDPLDVQGEGKDLANR